MNAVHGRILLALAVYVSFLLPTSSGHCGHWLEAYPECSDVLAFVFCDGNFTECGTSTERQSGNCTVETCDPMADDVIMALNGTTGEGSHTEGNHTDGNHTEGSMTSAGFRSFETMISTAAGSLGFVAWLLASS